MRPTKPAVTRPLDGSETLFLVQDGRIRRLSVDALRAEMGVSRRIEIVSGVAGTAIAIDPPFSENPQVIPLSGWAGQQRTEPYVVSLSADSITLAAKQTRSTTLLSAGPYQEAPNGTPVSVVLIET